ncbi:MAG: hypothetical protein P4K93_04125 [Terracidiphilus sp.]|nr:hypothetical protein [Terracidiphilus sp.]MDR3797310.1 hypothetical protein [Terracidiphilus sp.]
MLKILYLFIQVISRCVDEPEIALVDPSPDQFLKMAVKYTFDESRARRPLANLPINFRQ